MVPAAGAAVMESPRQAFSPHAYQQYCIRVIKELPFCGLFLDMGLGKTVITLTALRDLKYDMFQTRKALVVAPKKVAEGTWPAEAVKWEHLRGLRMSVAVGPEKERAAALSREADVYVINRENVPWLAKLYGNAWPFDTVVLDESTSFKSHQSQRFKAMKAVRPHISRLVELTGTPSPQGLTDLWAQVFLLDGGQRLGRTVSAYRDAYFVPGRRNRTTIFTYEPKAGAAEAIYRQISDICVSMKAEDYLQLPEMVVDDIPVALDPAAKKAYAELERTMLLEVGEDEVITAASAAALTGKLLQLCNGAVYDMDGNVKEIHRCKIEAFMETVEQLCGQHAIAYYYFRHDRDRLLVALSKTALRVRVYTGPEDAAAWNAGEVDVLLAQPASCGYGLNLQGGGHHVIWYGLTWSLEEYQQANKRLHRQGQAYPVYVHRLVVQGGVDQDVVRSLGSKDGAQEALLEALKARVARARGAA